MEGFLIYVIGAIVWCVSIRVVSEVSPNLKRDWELDHPGIYVAAILWPIAIFVVIPFWLLCTGISKGIIWLVRSLRGLK